MDIKCSLAEDGDACSGVLVALKECDMDIKPHLHSLYMDIQDATLPATEKELILRRKGI